MLSYIVNVLKSGPALTPAESLRLDLLFVLVFVAGLAAVLAG